jgi:hypothetical protein
MMTTTKLINKITMLKGNSLVGESILVTVGLSDSTALVEINGVIGKSNYVQFESEGTHFVNITAYRGNAVEKASRKIVISAPAQGTQPAPVIWSVEDRYSPRAVGFSVPNVWRGPMTVQHFEWDFGDGSKGISDDGLITHDYSDTLERDALHSTFNVTAKAVQADGNFVSSIRTILVFNLYGYNKTINRVICPRILASQALPAEYGVTLCLMVLQNLEDDEISLNNEEHEWLSTQALNEATHVTYSVPPIAIYATATPQLSMPIHSAVAITPAEFLRVPARSTVAVIRRFPQDKFTGGVFGVAVHLSGSNMCSHLPVKCSAYFEVKLPMEYGGRVIHGSVLSALNQLSRYSGASVFTHADITEATRKSAILEKTSTVIPSSQGPASTLARSVSQPTNIRRSRTASGNASAQSAPSKVLAGTGAHTMASTLGDTLFKSTPSLIADLLNPRIQTFDTEQITLGNECDPDNVPDDLPEGTVCQLTNELAWRYVPGRILNAKKGDVILSPGGQGLIGQLLRRVSPPQYYSHSGIMTKNHIEIRHSTGSEDWLKDHPSGMFAGNKGVDGFDPSALRFLWPGTITQSIDNAYSGEYLNSPDGKQYKLSSFSFDPSRGNINTLAYPLVVKPQAFDETPQVRSQLHSIADAALNIMGHYRFYCYTKPEIALDPAYVAGTDAGWAAGTLPTVCSSFVWLSAQHANIKLEGAAPIATVEELEISDTTHGAEVASDTLDGLYHYNADERQAAAQWLYQTIYDEAHDKAGFWGTLFTDAPDNVANQLCNTFASDWCDGDSINSDAWKTTGAANAVSPDNILYWDSPGFGNQQAFHSVYGFAEEAFFRPGTYAQVPIFRWKHVDTRGNLTGRVIALPSPEGTTVSLLGSGQSDFIVRGDGSFRFDNVPSGSYSITGGLNIGGYWASDEKAVEIIPGKTTDVTLVLQLDPGTNRIVNFTVHMETTNYAFADTDVSYFDMAGSVRVGPYIPNGGIPFDGGTDNPHGHISFDVSLKPDLSVEVAWTAQEVSDEVETEIKHTETIAKGGWLNWTGLTVVNDDPIDADNTVMNFTIHNDQAPA